MGAGVQRDAWLGSDKAASAPAKQGYKAMLQIKTEHGLYPKKFISTALEGATGGVWIVIKAIYQETPLTAIGYR
jgi:hypothetical protein